ncbi:hypothetical protein BH11PLA1_BH11PLA1_02450 [soil metagenome]
MHMRAEICAQSGNLPAPPLLLRFHPSYVVSVTSAASSSDFERRFSSRKDRPGRAGERGWGGAGGGGGGSEPVGKLFDRDPPRSLDAEAALLGAMIIDGRCVADVMQIVRTAEAFYSEAHGLLYSAIIGLNDRHNVVDAVLLEQRLRDAGHLELIGGGDYIAKLASAVPGAANAEHYARLVCDKHRLRKLVDAAGDILFEIYHHSAAEGEEAKRLIDSAEQRIFEIAQEDQGGDIEHMQALMQREIELLMRIADGHAPLQGIRCGFTDLDKYLGGFQPGEMIILAARPSMGKTALALNLAEQIATGRDYPLAPHAAREPGAVGIFSLEMSKSALAQRWLSGWSGIESQRIRSGTLASGTTRSGYVAELDEYKKLVDAAAALAQTPMLVDDTPGLSITAVRARARRMVAQHKVRCIMIDYLQLLSSPQQARESRQVEVSAISRGVKALARELNIPIIALSQLNRGSEGREGNRPRMSDLRESGSLEQDADVVLLLNRDEHNHKGEPAWDPNSPEFDEANRDKLGLAEIIIAKQRNGPTGVVTLSWDAHSTRFRNHVSGARTESDNYHAAPAPQYAAAHGTPARTDGFTPVGGAGGYGTGQSTSAPTWHAGRQSGPVANHRDGGGPERDDEEPSSFPSENAPF